MSTSDLQPAQVREALGLDASAADWLERLGAAPRPERVPLLSRSAAPGLLERLHVAPEDAAEIVAAWPDASWPPELLWILERVYAVLRGDLGGSEWLLPAPPLPLDLGPRAKHLHTYAYLALVPDVLAWHRARDIPEDVTWATLADLGRHLAIDRRMHGEDRTAELGWLTFHVRGRIFELGRLQFQQAPLPAATAGIAGVAPESPALSVHIPASGPLDSAACDDSFAQARAFFPRHFPNEPVAGAFCTSWLLDPQLAEYLDADSNIIRFQRRFELGPATSDARDDVMRFVFSTLSTPLDELPQETTLQRAVVAHLRSGRDWHVGRGWLPL
ncbi:MAG: hypothetical protein QOF43_1847 [Gaiellaceae bacterium]|nr:hypothetical protein [Gaiellaceae bacterium]